MDDPSLNTSDLPVVDTDVGVDGEGRAGPSAIPLSPRTVPVPANVKGTNARALLSVLKVFVMRTDPHYAAPWQMRQQRSSTGSAFIINTLEKLILTNSHVTNNATTIHVRRPGNPKKWKARLLCDGKVADLALLTVDDALFWEEDLVSLTLVEVPELQESILVAGYPLGGDSLSITQGIVSRITMTQYAKAWDNTLLGIQIDAAINPGNSGGPAFSNLQRGQVAGVAFSKLVHADNIGYIIPSSVVQHFLQEYREHSEFRGGASLGFRWQEMENTHMREFLKVPEGVSGILVYAIEPLSPAQRVLQPNDVLLELDDVPVADDGTVSFRNEERVGFLHIVRSKHVGDDDINLKLWRDGAELRTSYKLVCSRMLVPVLHGVDCVPSYFVVGGLVFMPLSWPFLEHAFGSEKWRKFAPLTITSLLWDYQEQEGQQVVVLYQILSHEINFGYRVSCMRCETFNGQKLVSLKHLTELVDASTDKYLHFGLEGGRSVVLERSQAVATGPKILEQHAIAFDRSVELRNAQAAAAAAAALQDVTLQ